jgi:hypothetical protein
MRIIIALLCGLCSFIAFSETITNRTILSTEERTKQEKKNMQILAEMGLPLPGSGIKIVPRSSLMISEKRLKQAQADREEIAKQGYISKYTLVPKELLHMKTQAKKELKLFKANQHNPQYMGLSPSVNDLKLAFKFKGIKERRGIKASGINNDITLLGAAIQGGFHEDKGGWSGAGQFF